MTELKLNDFESFDKILFDNQEPDWSKFYHESTDIFMPPIDKPVSLAEYQLNHYALWMVISVFTLMRKPSFYSEDPSHQCYIPVNRCYACEWCADNGGSCSLQCPLVLDDNYKGCGYSYAKYLDVLCNAPIRIKETAEEIAKLKWREVPTT